MFAFARTLVRVCSHTVRLCSPRDTHKVALRYHVERHGGAIPHLRFEIFQPTNENEVPTATVSRANATCPCCNTVLAATRVRSQLAAQHGGPDVLFDSKGNRIGGARLLAVVTVHPNRAKRVYRPAKESDYIPLVAAQRAASKLPDGCVPSEPSPVGGGRGAGRAFSVRNYGINTWGDLFSSRQKLALTTLAKIVRALHTDSAQAKSLAETLALVVDRCADYGNAFCSLHAGRDVVRNIFSRQALSIVWDYYESPPLSEGSGCFDGALDWVCRVVDALTLAALPVGRVELADACSSPLPSQSSQIWFTDPPYYDAVPYSDLSDFFFAWLKRCLPGHPLLRDPFDLSNSLTPKKPEIVQDETRKFQLGVKDRAFFESQMGRAFAEGRRVLQQAGIGCVVFAHKTTEGWEALLSGMLNAGWVITASWPVTTEMGSRLRARDSAALAGSVHLVCRPRPADAGVGDWSAVKAAMEKRIREWLPTLVKHGVRGADAIFSCLGPALESYSRYEKVLTAADREVPLGGDPDAIEPEKRGFLAYVFETLSKEALRQVLGDAETEGFEEDARMSALFLWTLQSTKPVGNGDKLPEVNDDAEDEAGNDEDEQKSKKTKAGFTMPFDTFIRLTRPMGIHYPALEGRVIDIEKGVVRLLPVRERSDQLLGEAARPGVEISLDDVQQMELGLATKRQDETALVSKPKRGQKVKVIPGQAQAEATFTALDRIHRAMLLFGLGRSTLLRQVLEKELHQSKRFERLALSLNALYPDGSEERRMLEGVQAAMRGI